MAQSGFTPISLYYSSVAGQIPTPTDLVPGEVGLNIADGRLYYKNNANIVVPLLTTTGGGTVTSINVTGGSTGLTTSGGPVTTAGTIALGGVLNTVSGGTNVSAAGAANNALLSDGTNWFSGGFPGSATGNGYVKLPGGVIIQWGRANVPPSASARVNFPIAFPNNVFSITFGANLTNANPNQSQLGYNFESVTGYTIWNGNNSSYGFSWMAIGN